MESRLNYTFAGMERSEALEKYAQDKIMKSEKLMANLISGNVLFSSNKKHRGTERDFRLELNFKMSKTTIHVEEFGDEMYALIDTATDKLNRNLKRYSDKQNQWDGVTPWKVIETEAEMLDDSDYADVDDYAQYAPKVTIRHKLEDLTPLEEGEAIEIMELLGRDQYLFRNKSGSYSMVYKRSKGGYGIVEPAESV